MKHGKSLSAVLLLMLLALGAAAGIDYRLPGPGEWTLEHRPQDRAALKENDGVLEIAFDVQADQPYQDSYLSFHQAVIRLLLKHPVRLDPSIKRILFEAKGIRTDGKKGTLILLMPVFRDANGETFVYKPHPQQHLKSGTPRWSGWKTNSFYSTEAGGEAADSFTAHGGDANSWPDGALTFLGFELAVRNPSALACKGSVELGGYAFAGLKLPGRDPFVYADALLDKPGTYRIASQVMNRYQGTPIRESEQEVTFDPARPSLARRKIAFALGPDDNYWIRYQIRTDRGEVLTTDQMRAWVEGHRQAPVPVPVDLRKKPSLGYLRINPGQPGCGVYDRREDFALRFRVYPPDRARAAGCELKWRIERFAFPEQTASGTVRIEFDGKPYVEVKAAPELPPSCDAFRLIAELSAAGKNLDRQEYVFGFKTSLSHPYTGRTGPRSTRNEVKQSAYVRVSYLPVRNGRPIRFRNRQECLDRFSATLARIARITLNVTYMIDTADFEILPGVYDFELLDRIMDTATDHGCRLTIRLSHADRGDNNILRWQRYWPQRNSDGTVNFGKKYYGSFSPADRNYIDGFLRAFRALHDRYRLHPAFQGYQIFEIAGEWAVLDQPWNGSIVGYEASAREAFVTYVRTRITDNLDRLNARWGTAFRSWSDVTPPDPELELGPRPDIRLYWIDFCEFKHYLDSKYWVETAAGDIRTYDSDGVIIVYNLDPGGFENADGPSPVDYLHNGGNHFLRGEGALMNAWNRSRIGWITEPHMPHRWAAYGDRGDRGWLLDWTTYIMLAQAGGGGANMHIYYWPLPGREDLSLPAHYGREYAYDRFEKWLPLLREMHGIRIKPALPQIAVLQDIYTLFCKHRTVFEPRMDDLRRWFGLLQVDSLNYEDYRQDHRPGYKLIMPNILDEVMGEDRIELVRTMVQAGSKTVVSAMTGSICPTRPGTSFALLRALGIKPPEKPFVTTAAGVTARVVTANPFLPEHGKIPFYTLADLKRETHSPEMKDRFYQWAYRWLPQTDYFRVYPGHRVTDGKVLAEFPDGGTALSLHRCGRGEVLVFWGMPDYSPERMRGFMQRVADWAGVRNPRRGSPVPLTMEGNHVELDRHYAIMYQDTPGSYRQKLPEVPEGRFFVDDLVSGQRFGVYTAAELHAGAEWTWLKGMSPLKILRMIPLKQMGARWETFYRMPR